jgi:hypothetical protein
MKSPVIKIEFISHNRMAECPADPAFPDGVEIDFSDGKPGWVCVHEIPYPAKCCGLWVVTCMECGLRVGITAAGRLDDPRCIKLPCKGERGVRRNGP